MKNLKNQLPLFFLLLFTSYFTYSQNPARDLQDIVGEKGSYAEMDLEKRGYVHIKTSKFGYDVYSNWWSPGKRKCIAYHLADGRVQSVVNVSAADCNKSNGAGYSNNSSYNHSSYHHSDKSHYDSRDHDAAFERGHSDGLYNKAYHNIYADGDLKLAYSDGYQSGVEQRSSSTRYHSNRGGYHKHARIDDIVGLSVDSAAERMGSRGFTEVNQFKHDGRTHRIYYNKETRQCIDVRSMHGKVGHVENSTRCNR
jgi:hypothetical protein